MTDGQTEAWIDSDPKPSRHMVARHKLLCEFRKAIEHNVLGLTIGQQRQLWELASGVDLPPPTCRECGQQIV